MHARKDLSFSLKCHNFFFKCDKRAIFFQRKNISSEKPFSNYLTWQKIHKFHFFKIMSIHFLFSQAASKLLYTGKKIH